MSEKLNFAELKAAGKLPSPKGAALRVMHLCQEETVSLPELARAIQVDPALAGRIIKIANYVNPNKSRPIASVTTDTLILIGIHAVRQAVLSMSLISNYHNGPCKLFDYEYFWSKAIAIGSAAYAISSINRVAPPAEIFNCGLMSGVGQLALLTARPEAYCEILSQNPDVPTEQLRAAQTEHFGIDEREMMVLMLQDWGIPKLFSDALYHHENPSISGFDDNSRLLRLTYSLQLASLLAHACMHKDDEVSEKIDVCGAILDLQPEQLDAITEQTAAGWADWSTLLNIPTRIYPPRKLHQSVGEAIVKSESVQETITPTASPLHILVACNDETQRNLLNYFLSAAGHTVAATDNGLTAMGLTSQSIPHVIIADWLMAGMDGLKLCTELRKTLQGKPLYFILLTPFEDERRRMEAYEAGVDEILRTPINTRLLAARLLAAQRIAKPGAG
jgi:HD-like signal output (HDOD) protein/ActR/RegA family two-component response regulator